MKKIFTYLLLGFVILSTAFSQSLEEKERKVLKENAVKTRVKWDYSFKNNKPSLDGKKSVISEFNKNGLLLKDQTLNTAGEATLLEVYSYDNNNNRTYYERTSPYGDYKKQSDYDEENKLIVESGFDGTAPFKTSFTYDSKNRVTEITYYINNLVDEKRVYTYTGLNAIVEILRKGEHITSKIELKFNDKNQLLDEKLISLDGKILEQRKLTYNDKYLLVSEEKNKNNEFFERQTYTYDAGNNLMTISEESKVYPKYDKKKYSYDELGRVIKYEWKNNPKNEYNVKTYKYNENNLCIEEHTFYPSTNYKLLSKYEYEYY